ncbi:MAG: hypothetical protein QOG87_1686 [Actinomycetota bacterium]|jgi:hypothetical protein
MFEKTPTYEAAYIGKFPCHDDQLGVALGWAVKRATAHGSGITVVAPSKSNFRDGALARLPRTIRQESWKTVRSTAGVVVAAWANDGALDKIDVMPNLKAMILMPWVEAESLAWRQARGAVDILGVHSTPALAGPNPVVAAALESVTVMVNLSTGLAHPLDRPKAIWAFKLLRDAGYDWEPEVVKAWALAHGWRPDGANELAEVAAGIKARKALRGGTNPFAPGAVDRWRADATAEEA